MGTFIRAGSTILQSANPSVSFTPIHEPNLPAVARITAEGKDMKNFFRSLSMGLGLSAIFAASNLNAAYVTQNIAIPFEFKVDKLTLPAGEYRVEQDFGKYLVSIVNVNTGRRVQVLRDYPAYNRDGRAKLIFEPTGQGYRLAKVS